MLLTVVKHPKKEYLVGYDALIEAMALIMPFSNRISL